MHRKFIALIIATAIAVTGMSALPARADNDAARFLAGLAAIALIGAAIESNRSQYPDTDAYVATPQPPRTPHHQRPRVQPPRNSRLDLPGQCLGAYPVNGDVRRLYGAGCLRNNYAFNGTLPYACRLGYSDGRRNRTGYEPRCLREHGYRVARW